MLASLFQLAGNLATGAYNAHLQEQQNQANAELVRQQNEHNLTQWQRATSYNSPSAQMERLKKAGINPALAYTNGIDNLAPASPEMAASQGVAPNIGTPFQDFAQNALIESQIELNQSEANKNNASAGLITVQSKQGELQFSIDSRYLETQTLLAIDKAGQEFKNLQATFDNISADTANKLLDGERLRKYIDDVMPAEIDKLAAEAHLSRNQAEDIVATFAYRVALLKAQTNKANSEADLAQAQADYQKALNEIPGYYQAVVDNIILDNQGKIITQSINIGNNRTAYMAGKKYFDGTDSADEVTDYDKTIYTIGEVFSILGKIFGVHFSN